MWEPLGLSIGVGTRDVPEVRTQEGRWKLPRLSQAIEIGTVSLPPFSVGQASHWCYQTPPGNWMKNKEFTPILSWTRCGKCGVRSSRAGPKPCALPSPQHLPPLHASGPIFRLVEIQAHPQLTSEAMERELHFTEYQLLFHMSNHSIFSKWLHAVM